MRSAWKVNPPHSIGVNLSGSIPVGGLNSIEAYSRAHNSGVSSAPMFCCRVRRRSSSMARPRVEREAGRGQSLGAPDLARRWAIEGHREADPRESHPAVGVGDDAAKMPVNNVAEDAHTRALKFH